LFEKNKKLKYQKLNHYLPRLFLHKEHYGFLYGALAALSASGMGLFVKLSNSAAVASLIFARFILAFPIVLWVIYHKKIHIQIAKVPKNLTRSIASILALYAYFYAVQMLPLVNAITLTNTTPLFLPIAVLVWYKLVVSKRRFLATAVGFLGVVILLRPMGDFQLLGSLLGLASGLFGAVALISVRQLSKSESTETILCYYFLIGAVISFFPVLFDWKPISEPLQWLYVLLSAVCALIYQFTLTKAFTHAPATKVGTTNYLAVVFGGIYGWTIFGEVPDMWVVIGTVLIISGAFIALFDHTPPRSFRK
jgi:drug/metabolite transporter (DMT)-like permease